MAFKRLMCRKHENKMAEWWLSGKKTNYFRFMLKKSNHALPVATALLWAGYAPQRLQNIFSVLVPKQHPTLTIPSGRRFMPDFGLAPSMLSVLSR